MNRIEIERKGKSTVIYFPEKWNELTAAQLLRVTDVWDEIVKTSTVYPAGIRYWRIRLLFFLADINPWAIISGKRRALMSILPSRYETKRFGKEEWFFEKYAHLPDLLRLTDFILDKNVDLTENKLPMIRIGATTLHGPAKEMYSMTVKEFVLVDTLFAQWRQTHSTELLDEMIAMLYRPSAHTSILSEKYMGDKRAPFNNLATDHWLPAVKRMKRKYKIAIALFYQGCRVMWEKKYPSVFPKVAEAGGGSEGWFEVLSELPAEKFGTFEERERVPVDTMLNELNRLLHKYQPKGATA